MNEEESLTNQFTMLIALRCTLTQSVLLGFRCGDTSSSKKNYLKANLGRALNTETRTAHHAQQSTLTDPLQHACSSNKEETTKEDSRTASVSEQGETTLTDIIHET